MNFTNHSVPMRNGEPVTLRATDDSRFVCPVCGMILPFAPYDLKTGQSAREYCSCCDTQFGWDDIIPPDAPVGTITDKWRDLRESWRRDHSRDDETEEQLRNLRIEKK